MFVDFICTLHRSNLINGMTKKHIVYSMQKIEFLLLLFLCNSIRINSSWCRHSIYNINEHVRILRDMGFWKWYLTGRKPQSHLSHSWKLSEIHANRREVAKTIKVWKRLIQLPIIIYRWQDGTAEMLAYWMKPSKSHMNHKYTLK